MEETNMTNKPLILGVVTSLALVGGRANAATDPYVVTIQQVGPNVVATSNAGGEFDTSGLTTSDNFGIVNRAQIAPSVGQFTFGNVTDLPGFDVSGPTDFKFSGITGTTPTTAATSSSGPVVGINGGIPSPSSFLSLPTGYMSGTPLAISQATFANKVLTCGIPSCLDGLGVQPGTYVWRWGAAPDQTFTIDAVAAVSSPEPATLGLMVLGLLGGAGFAGRKRRR